MNSIAVSGDTAPSADLARGWSVLTRVYSALVMLPVALACLWSGTPWFEILVAAATLIMAWEWRRICASGAPFGVAGAVLMVTVAAALLLSGLGRVDIAIGVTAAGAALTLAVAWSERPGGRWTALGVVAVGLTAVALVWLRRGEAGFDHVLWLFGAVVATDIAAYFSGRAIGGPKLAPRISPKKTWAGLGGGMIAAAAWTVAFGFWAGWSGVIALGVLGAAAAAVAQLGDLSVSVVKRRFGVKDASQLIPGHGGVLDRADGYVLAAPAAALLIALTRNGGMPWA